MVDESVTAAAEFAARWSVAGLSRDAGGMLSVSQRETREMRVRNCIFWGFE
jgi:hypothetical protein